MSAKTFREQLKGDRLESGFAEAKPPYSQSEAQIEANRCLFCFDAPCITACPTAIDIPGFIRKIGTNNIRGSAKTIFEANMLGTSCARVCPVDVLCVGACVYNDLNSEPIHIGRLQRYATETALAKEAASGRKLFEAKPRVGKKVALVGGGPASLACAAYLELEGVQTVIYERSDLPGGLNTTGIAPYKLDTEGSLDEVDWLLSHGSEIRTGVSAGSDVKAEELVSEYDAVFIGTGLGKDRMLDLGTELSPYLLGATDLIRDIKNTSGFEISDIVSTVLIIGGGNTAIDIAREMAGLNVENVVMVYRRGEKDMSGYRHEMEGARKQGVRLVENATPVQVVEEGGRITGLEVTTDGESQVIACDLIVQAIGQESLVARLGFDIETNDRGHVVVDAETKRTSASNIYAGGDCINGGKEVVNAAADGREAAFSMLRSWGIEPSLAR